MWELVGTPLRCKPIRLKWVYKAKRGDIAKHKAQLIKGFVQRGHRLQGSLCTYGLDGVRASCWRWRRGLVRPPHGREVQVPQRVAHQGDLRQATTGLHH